jgi:hypothetical protein
VRVSREFIPLFINTLSNDPTTERFGEFQGSYPVLRVLDYDGRDMTPRLDGNPVRGLVTTAQVLKQMQLGLQAFKP